jgi:hypothetical protein
LAGAKVGLDDALVSDPKRVSEEITAVLKKRSAFPRHPNVREFLNKRLQKAKLSRKEAQYVCMSILSDLDANGVRLRSELEDQMYYFDLTNRKLIKAQFDPDGLPTTLFGQFLYRRYGLSNADSRVLQWLAAQFTGEDPIDVVEPHRVIARLDQREDRVYYQVGDSRFVGIDCDGITLYDNGEMGVLFEANQVEPLDEHLLLDQFAKQNKSYTPEFWWSATLTDTRMKDQQAGKTIASLLYYMSPWLWRWRGMQLPIELVLGESGSGKSTLCALRLGVLQGRQNLRNAPSDIKDWHASISNAGGLHVTDNVQLVDKQMRHRLSDDICRLITEPDPHIEMRKYYTNAELMRIPVRASFVMTAIQQPFMNADLIQRAFIVEFHKDTNQVAEGSLKFDSKWADHKLEAYGGREAWVAHHLVVLHRFFKQVKLHWSDHYQAKHRLVNFEQGLIMMGKVFGLDTAWIPTHLVGTTEKGLEESDWTLEGLKAFVDYMTTATVANPKPNGDARYTSNEIGGWCMGHPDYEQCENLTSARRLGRYLKSHASIVAQVTGLVEVGSYQNRATYAVKKTKK